MALPPFSATIIPEFDTVNERPTWMVKFDGVPVARVVEVQESALKGPEYRILREDFDGPCPWNASGDAKGWPLQTHQTSREATWAVLEDLILGKEELLHQG